MKNMNVKSDLYNAIQDRDEKKACWMVFCGDADPNQIFHAIDGMSESTPLIEAAGDHMAFLTMALLSKGARVDLLTRGAAIIINHLRTSPYQRTSYPELRSVLAEAHATDGVVVPCALQRVLDDPLGRNWDELRDVLQTILKQGSPLWQAVRTLQDEDGKMNASHFRVFLEAGDPHGVAPFALNAIVYQAYEGDDQTIKEFCDTARIFIELKPDIVNTGLDWIRYMEEDIPRYMLDLLVNALRDWGRNRILLILMCIKRESGIAADSNWAGVANFLVQELETGIFRTIVGFM